MDPITFKLESNTLERLDSEAEEKELSRSEYLRNIIKTRDKTEELRKEYEGKIEEYERKIEELQRKNEELRDKLAAANDRIDDTQEVVEYVEEEKKIQRQERSRKEEWRTAPLWRKAKWMVTGMPDNNGEK